MMTKVAILTLVAISINGCFGIPVVKNCISVDLEDDVQALVCGSVTTTRYSNGTIIDVQYFGNGTLSVLQIGSETSACYLYRSSELPDGMDFAQGSETETREDATAETSAAIVALVPQCAGRDIYELVPETSAATPDRKKRWCRQTFVCSYIYIRVGILPVRILYCRYELRC